MSTMKTGSLRKVGIGLLDSAVAAQLRQAFEDDLRSSKELTLECWKRRPRYSHCVDWLAYQMHDQL